MKHTALTVLAASCALALDARAASVTFLHFNDFHAHLTPHADLVEHAGQTAVADRGGLARLATLVKQLRTATPSAQLLNVGDTFHGGVEAMYTNGNAIVAPINALGIDVGVPGNWDFAYGPYVTRLRFASFTPMEQAGMQTLAGGAILRPGYPNLAANLQYATPAWKAGEQVMPATLLKTVNGVAVGYVGITSDIVADMNDKLAQGFSFVTGQDKLRALIERHAADLRSRGAQVVVVLSELGLHKDYRLADLVAPGSVDVFFSAHTHELTKTPLVGKSGARVVESGNDGWLGEMTLDVQNGKVAGYRWTLHAIDERLPEDPQMLRLIALARAPFLAPHPNLRVPQMGVNQTLTQPIDSVVGDTVASLYRRGSLESPFNKAWAEALRGYAGTQLALTPGFRLDATVGGLGENYEDAHLTHGKITLEDVYRFFPMPFSIATATVDAPTLKKLIEGRLHATFALDSFAHKGGWNDGWGGLKVRTDLGAAPGSRVQGMALASGSPVTPDGVYSVAGCLRPMDSGADSLCGYPGFAGVTALANPETGAAWTVQDLFVKLAGEGRMQDPAAGPTFVNAGATPLWPAQPFVQPLAVDVSRSVVVSVRGSTPAADGTTRLTLDLANPGSTPVGLPLKLEVTGAALVGAQGQRYGAPFVKLAQPLPAGGTTTLEVVVKGNPAAARFALVSGGV